MGLNKRTYENGRTVITGENLNDIQDAIIELEESHRSHTDDQNNPHHVTAEQVGARPETWMPTAEEVGAHPNTWVPTPSQVGARPNTWLPTIAEIGAAPAGYGLGEERSAMVVATDANLCVKNGWYALWSDTPNGIEAGCVMRVDAEDENNVIQTAFSGHYTNAGLISLQRKKFRGTWDAWEWVNPPMIPGAEYRTTERWNGKAVYTKLIDCKTIGTGRNVIPHNLACEIIQYRGSFGNNAMPYQDVDYNGELVIAVSQNNIIINATEQHSGDQALVQLWYVK